METPLNSNFESIVTKNVRDAFAEDLSTVGDLTGQLVPPQTRTKARIITRESAIVCGRPWVEEAMKQVAPDCTYQWQVDEGQRVNANDVLLTFEGNAQQLLKAERTVLNFLQLLSAVATKAGAYQSATGEHKAQVVDTRKTIPGLRDAQKYAVAIGGGGNHRVGLYDAILIKENHIMATGSITQAVESAKELTQRVPHPVKFIQVEVESLEEFEEALSAGTDMVLLDNFSTEQLEQAVAINKGRAVLEASGGVSLETIPALAATGVDRISVGALTKDVKAIDLSMRFESE